MKSTGRVFSLNSLKLNFIPKLDRVRAILCITSAVGLLLGFILFSQDNNSAEISGFLFKVILSFKLGDNFLISLLIAATAFLSVILILIIFGSSVFGVVIIPLATLSVNCLFGMILAYSYHTYKITGLAFNSILLIPTFSVFLIGMTVSSSALLNYSLSQLKNLSKNRNSTQKTIFLAMLKKQLIAALVLIFNAVFEVVLNRIFITNFNF